MTATLSSRMCELREEKIDAQRLRLHNITMSTPFCGATESSIHEMAAAARVAGGYAGKGKDSKACVIM